MLHFVLIVYTAASHESENALLITLLFKISLVSLTNFNFEFCSNTNSFKANIDRSNIFRCVYFTDAYMACHAFLTKRTFHEEERLRDEAITSSQV